MGPTQGKTLPLISGPSACRKNKGQVTKTAHQMAVVKPLITLNSSLIKFLILELSILRSKASSWAATFLQMMMGGTVALSCLNTTPFLSNQLRLIISTTKMKKPGHLHWREMAMERIWKSELQHEKSKRVPIMVLLIRFHLATTPRQPYIRCLVDSVPLQTGHLGSIPHKEPRKLV